MINFIDKNGRRMTYFHIPRCGGTSILYGIFGAGLAEPARGKFFQRNRRLRYGAYHYNDGHGEFADHFPYAEAQRRGYTIHEHSFSIVRNPWQRCASRFLFLRDVERRLRKSLTFKQWLLAKPLADDNSEWRAGGWQQQYDYLCDQDGKLAVSKVYKLEQTDIAALFSDLLGRPLPSKLLNATRNYNYRAFYQDDHMIEAVAKAYAKDIKQFGYSFGQLRR